MTVPRGVNGCGLKIAAARMRLHQPRGDCRTELVHGLGSSPARRVPGAGTGITAQPIPFCSRRGRSWTLITPSPTPPRVDKEAQPGQPAGTRSVGALPPHAFLPPAVGRVRAHTSLALLHSQHGLGLNFWPQSLHGASKQAGTQWDSHGGGVWRCPGTAKLAPGAGLTCLHARALPQTDEQQESKETQTGFSFDIGVSCQASPRCRTPPAPSQGGDVGPSRFCLPHVPPTPVPLRHGGCGRAEGMELGSPRASFPRQDHCPEHRGTAGSAPSTCPRTLVALQ